MPRAIWSGLLLFVFSLPLASCFNSEGPCPTCPPANSASIVVAVPQLDPLINRDTLRMDSVIVTVDQAGVTLRPPVAHTVTGLASGRHVVKVDRWFTYYGAIQVQHNEVLIDLEEGERRQVFIAVPFSFVVWVPSPALQLAWERWAAGPAAARAG